jgi:hypothetical protein
VLAQRRRYVVERRRRPVLGRHIGYTQEVDTVQAAIEFDLPPLQPPQPPGRHDEHDLRPAGVRRQRVRPAELVSHHSPGRDAGCDLRGRCAD